MEVSTVCKVVLYCAGTNKSYNLRVLSLSVDKVTSMLKQTFNQASDNILYNLNVNTNIFVDRIKDNLNLYFSFKIITTAYDSFFIKPKVPLIKTNI